MTQLLTPGIKEAINSPLLKLTADSSQCQVVSITTNPALSQNNSVVTVKVYPKGTNVKTDNLTGKRFILKRGVSHREALNGSLVNSASLMVQEPITMALFLTRFNLLWGTSLTEDDFLPVTFDNTGNVGDLKNVMLTTSPTNLSYYGSTTLYYYIR